MGVNLKKSGRQKLGLWVEGMSAGAACKAIYHSQTRLLAANEADETKSPPPPHPLQPRQTEEWLTNAATQAKLHCNCK